MADRYIPHPQNPRWNAHSHTLREMLGLPKKLGPKPKAPVFIARIADNTGEQVEIWDLPTPGERSHRLHAKYGDRMIPVGRLHQTRF